MNKTTNTLATILFGVAAANALAQHHHEGDFIVGVNGAGAPQLKIEGDEHLLSGEELISLPESLVTTAPGWLGDARGFESLEADEPDEDFFMLAPGAEIRLVGLDVDAALFVRAASLGTPVRISPSPTLGYLDFGGDAFHAHVIWHIDSSASGFEPSQTTWSGTFKLVDAGTTGYADSDPFTLRFTPAPEPASIAMLLAGGLILGARRRNA